MTEATRQDDTPVNPDTEMAKIPVALADCMTAILALPAREARDATADLQALVGDLRHEAAQTRARFAADLMEKNQWTVGELAEFMGVSLARASQITSEVRRGRQPPDLRPIYVYVMGGPDRRYVKIGYTRNPRKRLIEVRLTCPFPLSILWQREGSPGLETALHQRFADYRRQGEWFEFPADQDAVEVISRAADDVVTAQRTLVRDTPAERERASQSEAGNDGRA